MPQNCFDVITCTIQCIMKLNLQYDVCMQQTLTNATLTKLTTVMYTPRAQTHLAATFVGVSRDLLATESFATVSCVV